jgi:hypothetical protein
LKKKLRRKKQPVTKELLDRDDDSSIEYSCSEEKSQDCELSSDYVTTVVGGRGKANAAVGSDEDSVLDEVQNHRQAFYRYYNEYYERVKGATHLIDNAKYDKIVSILQ